mgnify:CR=1 FL=1
MKTKNAKLARAIEAAMLSQVKLHAAVEDLCREKSKGRNCGTLEVAARQAADDAAMLTNRAAVAMRADAWDGAAFVFHRAADLCLAIPALILAGLESVDGRTIKDPTFKRDHLLLDLATTANDLCESALQLIEGKGDDRDAAEVLDQVRATLNN